jgi:hypothetical protein
MVVTLNACAVSLRDSALQKNIKLSPGEGCRFHFVPFHVVERRRHDRFRPTSRCRASYARTAAEYPPTPLHRTPNDYRDNLNIKNR